MKTATIKSKDRKNDFSKAGLPSPPVPVITRWATWLRAASYYSKNLLVIRTIVNNWTCEYLLIILAKEAINVDGLEPDLVRIKQYRTLTTNVELLEASECTMTEAYEPLKNMHFLYDPCTIQAYIKKQLSNSDLEAIINCPNVAVASITYVLSPKAQPTSAAAEQSTLSKLQRKNRNFDIKIVRKYMLMYFNK